MTTSSPTAPDVAPPPGARFVDDWGSAGDGLRVILGDIDDGITDNSDLLVTTSCVQHLDGHVDDGSTGNQSPSIYIENSNCDIGIDSDQARELAALLLAAAVMLDEWVRPDDHHNPRSGTGPVAHPRTPRSTTPAPRSYAKPPTPPKVTA